MVRPSPRTSPRRRCGRPPTRPFDGLLHRLAFGPAQPGTVQTPGAVVIGWGRKDRVTLPRQANRAMEKSPEADLHWFEASGHSPLWDEPGETVDLILVSTGSGE